MKEIYLVRGLKRISGNWTRNINTVVYLACLSAQSTGRRCAYRGIRFNSNPLHYYYELIVMRNGAIKLILIRIVTTRPLFASFYWLSPCDGMASIIFGRCPSTLSSSSENQPHPPTWPDREGAETGPAISGIYPYLQYCTVDDDDDYLLGPPTRAERACRNCAIKRIKWNSLPIFDIIFS